MFISGVIVAVIGYMCGLTILQAIGGILAVVMWSSSGVFFPAAARGLEVAGADFDARPQIRAEPMGRPVFALRRRITAHRARRHSRAAAVGLAPRPSRGAMSVSTRLTAAGPRHARSR